jgi:murein DD-endopeptidase MepM/ murein hydrolase activator NlpD
MRPPLNIRMKIRTAKEDAAYKGAPGVKAEKLLNSPAGGAFGFVRSDHHQAHQGWDIYAPPGTPVIAIAGGTIVWAGTQSGYGRCIILKFAVPHFHRPLYALYAHLSEISVLKGEVKEGDPLGKTGTDGNAKGHPPHLHFEIRTREYIKKEDAHPLKYRMNPGDILAGHYNL